jgi:hypothetical protein
MKAMIRFAGMTAIAVAAFVSTGRAQQKAPEKITTFKIDVTLTRMDGTRALGSSPYSLLVNTGNGYNRASLRIGIEVPTGSATTNTVLNSTGSNNRSETTTTFKNVGTQIDAYVSAFDETRYAVDVSINDTAIFSDGDETPRILDARANLELAQKALERQKSLFAKKLSTQSSLDRAEAAVRQNEIALNTAMRGSKSLPHANQMAFRSFTSSNRVYLRDGESQEMTVATDRTTGETVRASVKLTVVK